MSSRMFCPRCHGEYRDGFLRCAECGAALVPALSEPAVDDVAEEEQSWVTFPIRDAAMLSTARSLLLSSDIPFHVVDEVSSKHVPKILVPQSCAADVEALLRDLKRSRESGVTLTGRCSRRGQRAEWAARDGGERRRS